MDGLIKYKVGDSWSASVTDSYKTMFFYYHSKENIPNPIEGQTLITDEVLRE